MFKFFCISVVAFVARPANIFIVVHAQNIIHLSVMKCIIFTIPKCIHAISRGCAILLDVLCSESFLKLMGLQHFKDQNKKQILCWPILDKIAGGRSRASFFLHPLTGQKSFERAMTWESFLLLSVLFGRMSSVRPGRIKVQAVA